MNLKTKNASYCDEEMNMFLHIRTDKIVLRIWLEKHKRWITTVIVDSPRYTPINQAKMMIVEYNMQNCEASS